MAKLADDPQIQHASLHNPLPLQLHTYIWPFLIIWPAFFAFYLSEERYDTYIQGQEWTFVFAGSIITAQSLLWLMTKWNININTLFTTTSARSIDTARLIKVIPITNAGSAEICTLLHDNSGGKKTLSFLFQKRRFLYYPERQTFAPLDYVLDAEPKPALKYFQQSKGLTTKEEIESIQHHYGDNTFDIPVPGFVELFQEHAVAPFFVFQIFCVGLWMLDEYWYYSLFTLFMLVMFESTVVWQRQRTLSEFRGMNIKPYDVWVYREKKWLEITSDKLLPGDLMSVNRTKEDGGVACDILLIEGSVIVNEAMLSGESTHLLKDSVQLRPSDDSIEPEGLDKNSFVHGGTKVLQITHPNVPGEEVYKNLASGITAPPDNGALGVVVKTGFETSQGSLVRTMIYSTERSTGNDAVDERAAVGGNLSFIKKLRYVLRYHWKPFVYACCLSSCLATMGHGTMDLYPTFLTTQRGLNIHQETWVTCILQIGGILGGIFGGFFSHRINPKWVAAGAGLLCAPFLPLWTLPKSWNLLALGAFWLQFFYGAAIGNLGNLLQQLCPHPGIRAVFTGVAYNIGNAVSSCAPSIETALGERFRTSDGTPDYAKTQMGVVGVVIFFLVTVLAIMPLESLNKSWDQEDPNQDIPTQAVSSYKLDAFEKSDDKPTCEEIA